MTKDEIIYEVGKPILRPLGLIQGVFLITLMISPFCCIWGSWLLAVKVGLTGLVGTYIFHVIYEIAKIEVIKEVDKVLDHLNKKLPAKSAFLRRLEKMNQKKN